MSKSQKNKTKAKPSSKKHTSKHPTKQSNKIKPNLWLFIGLGVVALVVIGPLLYMQFAKPPISTAEVKLPLEIPVVDAFEKYQDGTALFLDVRTQEEWVDYHAPNSILIPLDQLPSRLSELPRDREIVVVCRAGNRSQQGRDILLNAGFSQVTSLTGGLFDWRQAGFPTVSGP